MYSQLVLARSTLGLDSYPESLPCVSGMFGLLLSASVAVEDSSPQIETLLCTVL